MFLKTNEKYGVIEAYWLDFHKSIYIAFKLLYTLPMYNKKIINVSICLKSNICENMHVNVGISHLINYSQNVGTLWLEFLFLHFFHGPCVKKNHKY
jgi:hypothetical protein